MHTTELAEVTQKVRSLTSQVRTFIQGEAQNFDLSKIERKSHQELVSYVDKESEKRLVEGLREILPEAAFITEESTVEREDKEYIWVIDPLDGTTNFLHKLPPYSISVALMQNKKAIAGVVHELNLDECFYAWREGGAYRNGEKISIAPTTRLNEALIVTGFPYNLQDKTDPYFEIIKAFVRETHGVRRLGSAAVDLAYVACGRLDAYFEFNLKIWDIAAGILIVEEAGGKVSDFSGGGDYLFGKEIIAANAIHSEVIDVVKKYWK